MYWFVISDSSFELQIQIVWIQKYDRKILSVKIFFFEIPRL